MQSNDATSAFAGLVESQVIEQKASTYEGSGSLEDEDAVTKLNKKQKLVKPMK